MDSPFGQGHGFTRTTSLLTEHSAHARHRMLLLLAGGLVLSIGAIVAVMLNFSAGGAAASQVDSLPSAAVPPTNGSATVTFITPASPIQAGTALAEGRFTTTTWRKEQLPSETIVSRDELSRMYAKSDLAPGLPITRSQLTNEGEQTSLSVTPGHRAVTIQVDDLSGVSGHALPGSSVDVVLTYRDHEGEIASTILVPNARILSAGGDTTAGSHIPLAARLGRRSNSLTLEVATEDALKIQTAKQMGTLSLLLRNDAEKKNAPKAEVRGDEIDTGGAKKAEAVNSGCNRGKIRMGGEEYLLDCNGGMTPLGNDAEK